MQRARRLTAAIAARAPRRRRDPETARAELMDAAETVFAAAHPDDVGLKEVARAAGVSHALITHYFGTYAGLIEATLERRLRAMRAKVLVRLADASALERPEEVLAMLFDALEDPVHLRLFRWLIGSERQTTTQLFQDRGLTVIANQVARAICPSPIAPEVIEKIEVALIAAVSAANGYALTKRGLAAAAGRRPSKELDAQVLQTLGDMLRAYLRAELLPIL